MVTIIKKGTRLLILSINFVLLTGCVNNTNGLLSKSCKPVMSVKHHVSAEFYYDMMLSCMKEKNVSEASIYYGLAGVTTWYDAQKHPGKLSKERHKNLLKKALSQMSLSDKNQLWDELNKKTRTPTNLKDLCDVIASRSPDSSESFWENAMTSYLHCPVVLDASRL